MILTKKGLLKILLVAFLYLIIGGGCIAAALPLRLSDLERA